MALTRVVPMTYLMQMHLVLALLYSPSQRGLSRFGRNGVFTHPRLVRSASVYKSHRSRTASIATPSHNISSL
ncbi:hypothetical protein B0J13DRAFT_572995 [Dactylonectria estremocensis]|uniref:Secreted protein n=1 Tax=Dactylonectria estremocensis TaxID=1079267 RepID=A0A9P9ICH2_9HYPO|nr:hypothetical protein B0J13DRAFT_572995 [Dactylonectria estremocensis]